LVVAVVVAVLLSMWVTFTLTRLDRLHARVDAAHAALDAQLVRRAAALLHVAEAPDSALPDALRHRYQDVASRALAGRGSAPESAAHPSALSVGVDTDGEEVENEVGRAVLELDARRESLPVAYTAELREGAARVRVARRFYNDAVRDTRALRQRRMPRLLRLAGHRAVPAFFDIDDSVPAAAAEPTAAPAPAALTTAPEEAEELP
jgi:hypothetical protein